MPTAEEDAVQEMQQKTNDKRNWLKNCWEQKTLGKLDERTARLMALDLDETAHDFLGVVLFLLLLVVDYSLGSETWTQICSSAQTQMKTDDTKEKEEEDGYAA